MLFSVLIFSAPRKQQHVENRGLFQDPFPQVDFRTCLRTYSPQGYVTELVSNHYYFACFWFFLYIFYAVIYFSFNISWLYRWIIVTTPLWLLQTFILACWLFASYNYQGSFFSFSHKRRKMKTAKLLTSYLVLFDFCKILTLYFSSV